VGFRGAKQVLGFSPSAATLNATRFCEAEEEGIVTAADFGLPLS